MDFWKNKNASKKANLKRKTAGDTSLPWTLLNQSEHFYIKSTVYCIGAKRTTRINCIRPSHDSMGAIYVNCPTLSWIWTVSLFLEEKYHQISCLFPRKQVLIFTGSNQYSSYLTVISFLSLSGLKYHDKYEQSHSFQRTFQNVKVKEIHVWNK